MKINSLPVKRTGRVYVLGLLSSSSLLINDYKLEDSPLFFSPLPFPCFSCTLKQVKDYIEVRRIQSSGIYIRPGPNEHRIAKAAIQSYIGLYRRPLTYQAVKLLDKETLLYKAFFLFYFIL